MTDAAPVSAAGLASGPLGDILRGMTLVRRSAVLITIGLMLSTVPLVGQQRFAGQQRSLEGHERKTIICGRCVHSDMRFLASNALEGRGSGTRNEHLAALFAASLFEDFGLAPGGNDGYLQKAPLPDPLPPPVLRMLKGFEQVPRRSTWNAIGILRGRDPGMRSQVVLLTAHLDHLGIGPAVDGDDIYNGADDDSSGVTAVLELARLFTHGQRPRRTIIFALFGSEEIGGFGNRYFLRHPPAPLGDIVANLEFEMIGRPDPLVPRGKLWLTGYNRSDLGPVLAAHGAPLVADPRPRQRFFERSDNYDLAKHGIIAQTVSSFGLYKEYHQPSDDLSRIDFPHLDQAIQAMARPILWLANTTWKPGWKPGGKPREHSLP